MGINSRELDPFPNEQFLVLFLGEVARAGPPGAKLYFLDSTSDEIYIEGDKSQGRVPVLKRKKTSHQFEFICHYEDIITPT